jgi:hypothetical protein
MKLKQLISAFLLLAAATFANLAQAGATDIEYSPTTSAGHDFNHAPVGQSFLALAAQVKAGIYIADETSFTNWLSTVYGQMPPYPYAVAPSITVNIKLLAGEGPAGSVIDSRDVTLAAPFMGFVDVDYSVDGLDNSGNVVHPKVDLIPGNKYTILLTDVSNQAYPNGVVGWVVPGVHDYGTGAATPPGAYPDGLPILQGALVSNDAGIGDNAFHVIDMNPSGGSTAPQACSGANAVITSVGRDFIVVNGGQNLADHVWYAPQAGTTFTGGTTTFVAGELVTYSGTLDAVAGCYAATMTVMPAPAPVVISGTLPNGQAGVPYSAALTASGGVAPYLWSASGMPAGVTFSDGAFSGIPTAAGSYSVAVSLADSLGGASQTTYNVTIAATTSSCTKSKGAKEAAGKGAITEVGGDYVVAGGKKVYYAACTKISFGGYANAFAVGQSIEWEGYSLNGKISAKVISVN